MSETFDTTAERKRPGGFLDLGDDDICQRAKRRYNRVALALFGLILAANGIAIIISLILKNAGVKPEGILKLVLSFAPLYLVGVPVAILIMKPMPTKRPKEEKLPFGRILVLIIVSIFFMLAGNIIGQLVSYLLSGGTAENRVTQLVTMEGWLQFIPVVILAPIFEELVFRKLLIDRVGRFGEKIAIIFSALAFALFHTNFFQFFYCFAIGLVFAYAYVRTGKYIVPVLMHMLVNILGGLVPTVLMRLAGANGVDAAQLQNITPDKVMSVIGGMLPLVIFELILWALGLAGLILLIVFAKKVHFEPAKDQIPKGRAFSTVYLTVGFILYFLLCIGLAVYTLLP
ncbi:MAG: CPBP family intramembrane glutamic endopeptidase [Lachnospiraceae bacterium]